MLVGIVLSEPHHNSHGNGTNAGVGVLQVRFTQEGRQNVLEEEMSVARYEPREDHKAEERLG